jgi:hypothetical protein
LQPQEQLFPEERRTPLLPYAKRAKTNLAAEELGNALASKLGSLEGVGGNGTALLLAEDALKAGGSALGEVLVERLLDLLGLLLLDGRSVGLDGVGSGGFGLFFGDGVGLAFDLGCED